VVVLPSQILAVPVMGGNAAKDANENKTASRVSTILFIDGILFL
jgi:hypothetical protein